MLSELVAAHRAGSFADQLAHGLGIRNARRADMRLVKPKPNGIERMDVDPFREARFIAQEPLELGEQRVREGVGESGQQDPGIGMRACQVRYPVQRDDGLAGPGRAGDARRTGVVALDHVSLVRVEENRPLVPGEIERALQLVDARYGPESALRIGMAERFGS
jgi:hypothetical protein